MSVARTSQALRSTSSVALALVGAGLIILGQLIPWGFDQTIARSCPAQTSDCIFNVIEHGGGAIPAVIGAIVLLRAPARRSFGGGLLLGTGVTSALIWVGHLGYVTFSAGSFLDLGWYAGFIGSVSVLLGGWLALRRGPPPGDTLGP